MELRALLDGLMPLVAEAGRFLVSEWRRRPAGGTEGSLAWAEEKSAKDLVSFVDRESEALLARGLAALLPGSAFYGEEGEKSRGELTWVVDPLDGTTNYIAGLDWYCISVALFEKAAEPSARPILGLVHRPTAGEWYWALRGGGAWEASGEPGRFEAERRLPAALPASLRGCLVGTGTPYRSPDTARAFFAAAAAVSAAALDLRRMGSAALELCQVAAGRIGAFWEVDLKPYDVGAGLLMLEEAGCPATGFDGSPYRPFSGRSLVTGAPGAAEELRRLVAPCYQAEGGYRDSVPD